jgi:hypothetical protein
MNDKHAPAWAYAENEVLVCNAPGHEQFHGYTCVVRERFTAIECEATGEPLDINGGAYSVYFPLLNLNCLLFEHMLHRPGETKWLH